MQREREPKDIRSRLDELHKHFPRNRPADPFPDSLWNSVRSGGMRLKDSLYNNEWKEVQPPGMREIYWLAFKEYWASHGNFLPWLIYETEPQPEWTGLFERTRPRLPENGGVFDDLPPRQRAEAEQIFERLCKKWEPYTWDWVDWRRPILAGIARRLAAHPDNRSPEWGKRMRRIKGGKHVQARYRARGWHPLASVRKAWGLTGEPPKPQSTAGRTHI